MLVSVCSQLEVRECRHLNECDLKKKTKQWCWVRPPGNDDKWINMKRRESLWSAYEMRVKLKSECFNTAGNMSQDTSAAYRNTCTGWLAVYLSPVCGVWVSCTGLPVCPGLLLQIHTALYKHSATERNVDAHITVDKMSQSASWEQFEYLHLVSLWNRNSLCTFLISGRFLAGRAQNS